MFWFPDFMVASVTFKDYSGIDGVFNADMGNIVGFKLLFQGKYTNGQCFFPFEQFEFSAAARVFSDLSAASVPFRRQAFPP